jgi:hypothetical protein
LEIFDLSGRLRFSHEVRRSPAVWHAVPLPRLQPGMYAYRVATGTGRAAGKLCDVD